MMIASGLNCPYMLAAARHVLEVLNPYSEENGGPLKVQHVSFVEVGVHLLACKHAHAGVGPVIGAEEHAGVEVGEHACHVLAALSFQAVQYDCLHAAMLFSPAGKCSKDLSVAILVGGIDKQASSCSSSDPPPHTCHTSHLTHFPFT